MFGLDLGDMSSRQLARFAELVAGRPEVVVFFATGSVVSGGPRMAERGKAGLGGRPMPGPKAFIGGRISRDVERWQKVARTSPLIKDQGKWSQETPLD